MLCSYRTARKVLLLADGLYADGLFKLLLLLVTLSAWAAPVFFLRVTLMLHKV
jgi:hypothetical protein